jgi:hypothetical protein
MRLILLRRKVLSKGLIQDFSEDLHIASLRYLIQRKMNSGNIIYHTFACRKKSDKSAEDGNICNPAEKKAIPILNTMKNTLLKKVFAGIICTAFPFLEAGAQGFTENFDNVSTLAGNGWVMTNNSAPLGAAGWMQGPGTPGGYFDAFNGAPDSYISADQNNTTGTGTISNWLLTPNRTFRNGDVFTFYTRKVFPDNKVDRVEVRMSTNGASTNVGTGAGSVGDFTTLLLAVNPVQVLGAYPTAWTQYTITISGLSAPTSGRLTFRYYIINGGPTGTMSEFIGIDNVVYTPYVCPTITMSPAGGALTGGAAGTAYSNSLSQTGALGAPSFNITAGALPPGLTLSASGTISGTPTATGTFNFTATVSDNSGCSGSQSYSLTAVCAANPTSLNGLPALCSNDGAFTLTEGAPAGGTYSGTGVAGGTFDPAAGTQTITYDYTDPYGCAFAASAPITVNTVPTVTQSAFTAVCSDNGPVALSGGSPAGGTYSGTGVTGTDFDPAAETQTITYTYTDANGCADEATAEITVHELPNVSLVLPLAATCLENNPVTLSGAAPAGGTFSGTGVTGADFNPATAGVGTQLITYSYTDANGCVATATDTIAVTSCLGIAENTQAFLQAYPNPGNGLFTIAVDAAEELTAIQIFDIQGKVVENGLLTQSGSVLTLDLTETEKGMYILKGLLNGKPVSVRLIKK